MNCKYIILSNDRYVIYQYSNGMFGASIKVEGDILQLSKQYHDDKDAIEGAEASLSERGMVEVLESENIEQMTLF